MKQPIIYTLLLVILFVSGCSFIASANEEAEKDKVKEQPMYDITMETDLVEFKEYHITIHYPQTPNNRINQTIVDYVNQQKASFKQESYKNKQNTEETESHELHIDFDVIHQDQRFFVVHFTETMDVGEDELMTGQTVMNFDKQNGELLTMEELFKDDLYYVERLYELTIQKLESEEMKGGTAADDLEATASTFENTAITGEGLLVFLDSSGPSVYDKVLLEMEQVTPLLRSQYVEDLVKSLNIEKDHKSVEAFEPTPNFESERLDEEGKKVALTFDDGPHPEYTDEILDLLDRHEARASFFMIGKRVSFYPDMAREVAASGHEIGGHTWNHPRLSRLGAHQVEEQITSTQRMIKLVTGKQTELIRLPFGEAPVSSYNHSVEAVPWTVYSEKWSSQGPEKIAQDILSQVEDGSIVLLHELQNNTVETVKILLDKLSSKGYQFVAVSDLME
ncbi:polysaccharide deacetylase family protein [Halobacillus litoralis]|uniref:polysaccharide deacetylase family protein n=1 Tax=Halobacillus litoralis TaxID=45668 RepID=UPI001CFEF7DA|nr:polysaccharide deacetylase family protein [Halobacillus litoralis]